MGAFLAAALAFVRGVIGAAPIVSVLVALLGSGIGTAVVVSNAKDFWFQHVDTPRIEKAARDAQQSEDATVYEAAAARAKHELEERLFKIVDKFSTDAAQRQAEDDAFQQEQVNELLQEITDYQAQRKDPEARKKYCGLTDDDIRFAG